MRVLAVLVILMAAAPAARADTIVFRKGTDVWRMAPDGSAQTPLTGGERRYEWPSAADDGTIVASDETGRLCRMTLDGVALGPGIPTAATTATEDVARRDTHARPDLARRHEDRLRRGDRRRPDDAVDARPGHRPRLPGPGDGAGGPRRPVVDRQQRAAAQPGRRVAGARRDVLRSTTLGRDDSAEPWFGDDASTWATGFDAAASRDGRRIAVLEDDSADNDGTPTRVALRLFTADGGTPGSAASSRSRRRTPTPPPARPSRPTAPASPGPRATASTSRRSARSPTAPRSASRSSRSPAPGSPTGRPRPRARSPARRRRPHSPSPSRPRPARAAPRCASTGCARSSRVSAPTTIRLSVRVGGHEEVRGGRDPQARRRRHARRSRCACARAVLAAARRLILHVSAPGRQAAST